MSNSGYSIEQSVLSNSECDDLIAALSGIRRSRAGARHLMAHPAVATLATDPRLLTIARDSLSAEAIPYRATLFEKSPQANWLVTWHQDTALPLASRIDATGWGPWSKKAGVIYAHVPVWALSRIVALRVHLDASTSENGPLRIVLGSHAAGVLSDDEVRKYVQAHGYAECVTQRGGVVAMTPMTIHSSSKARSSDPRRVLRIEYADALDLEPGIRLAIA